MRRIDVPGAGGKGGCGSAHVALLRSTAGLDKLLFMQRYRCGSANGIAVLGGCMDFPAPPGAVEPVRRRNGADRGLLARARGAGDPGIEPGVAVLETAVLPIHQSPWGWPL